MEVRRLKKQIQIQVQWGVLIARGTESHNINNNETVILAVICYDHL